MSDPDQVGRHPGSRAEAGGPRLDPETLALSGTRLTVRSTARLLPDTLVRAVTVTVLEPGRGWSPRVVVVRYDETTLTLRVDLDRAARKGTLVRLVVRGSGPSPAMGRGAKGELLPLAGTVGSGPVVAPNGADAVLHVTGP